MLLGVGYQSGERYATEKTAFLDSDEIDALIRSLDFIKDRDLGRSPGVLHIADLLEPFRL
jgi:hypothetical protein